MIKINKNQMYRLLRTHDRFLALKICYGSPRQMRIELNESGTGIFLRWITCGKSYQAFLGRNGKGYLLAVSIFHEGVIEDRDSILLTEEDIRGCGASVRDGDAE